MTSYKLKNRNSNHMISFIIFMFVFKHNELAFYSNLMNINISCASIKNVTLLFGKMQVKKQMVKPST